VKNVSEHFDIVIEDVANAIRVGELLDRDVIAAAR
jgi:hypothetical protein